MARLIERPPAPCPGV